VNSRSRGLSWISVALLASSLPLACAPDQRLTRAANALDRDLQREATARAEARTHPRLVAQQAAAGDERAGQPGLGAVEAARVTTMVEVAGGVVLPAIWTEDGWKINSDLSVLFPDDTPRGALRSFLRAVDLERWDVVAGFAPRRFREELTPEAVRRVWTGGPESDELHASRDLLREGLEGPLFVDAHSATLLLAGDRAAHLEREGARWVIVDF